MADFDSGNSENNFSTVSTVVVGKSPSNTDCLEGGLASPKEPPKILRNEHGQILPGQRLPGVELAKPGAGRPSNAVVAMREKMEKTFASTLRARVKKIANHYVERVFVSDRVLVDARKAIFRDAGNGESPGGGASSVFVMNFGTGASVQFSAGPKS